MLLVVVALLTQLDGGVVDPRVADAQDLRASGRRTEALELLSKVAADATKKRDDLSRGRALQKAGDVQLDEDDCGAAKKSYELALKALKKEPLATAQVQNDLGLRARRCGELTEAKRRFGQALAYYRSVKDRAGVRKLANNLASAHFLDGDKKKALVFYAEAAAAAKDTGDDEGWLTVQTNVALMELLLVQEKLNRDCRQFTAADGKEPGYQRVLAAMKEALEVQRRAGREPVALCARWGENAVLCEPCVLNVLPAPK